MPEFVCTLITRVLGFVSSIISALSTHSSSASLAIMYKLLVSNARPAAEIVNYVGLYHIKITQLWRRLGIPHAVTFHVRPGNRPAITGVALCHKEVGHLWYKYSNSLLAKLAFVCVTKCIETTCSAYSRPSAVLLNKFLHTSILGTVGAIAIMMYSFFWVITRRLNFMCRRPGHSCLHHL